MSDCYISTRQQSKQIGRYALPEATCKSCHGKCKINRDGRPPRCRRCAHKEHTQDMQETRRLIEMVEPEPLVKIEMPKCTPFCRRENGWEIHQPHCEVLALSKPYPRIPLDYSSMGMGD